MAQMQFSLVKRNKDWTSRTLATLTLTLLNFTHFRLSPPLSTPRQSGRHMCITSSLL